MNARTYAERFKKECTWTYARERDRVDLAVVPDAKGQTVELPTPSTSRRRSPGNAFGSTLRWICTRTFAPVVPAGKGAGRRGCSASFAEGGDGYGRHGRATEGGTRDHAISEFAGSLRGGTRQRSQALRVLIRAGGRPVRSSTRPVGAGKLLRGASFPRVTSRTGDFTRGLLTNALQAKLKATDFAQPPIPLAAADARQPSITGGAEPPALHRAENISGVARRRKRGPAGAV